MRPVISLLLIATLFAFGCGEEMDKEMVVTEKEVVEEEMVVELTSLDKAEEDLDGVKDRIFEEFEKGKKTGDYSLLFTAVNEIYQDELDFEKDYWQKLVTIWEEIQIEKYQAGEITDEVAERYMTFYNTHLDKFFDKTLGKEYYYFVAAYDNVIIEYLRLSYEYPDSSEDELIDKFKESIQETDIEIVYPEGF